MLKWILIHRYLLALYESWNKSKKVDEWRAKLLETEAMEE